MPKVDATMDPIFISIWKIVECLTNIYSNKTRNLGVLLKGDEAHAKEQAIRGHRFNANVKKI
jgi:hypothetical protein